MCYFYIFQLSTILRTILRDEIVAVQLKSLNEEKPCMDANGEVTQPVDVDMAHIVVLVNKAVAAIVQRLNTIAHSDAIETNEMTTLMQAAQNADNLCRMDPAWHPWL